MNWRELIERLLDQIQDDNLLKRIYSLIDRLFVCHR